MNSSEFEICMTSCPHMQEDASVGSGHVSVGSSWCVCDCSFNKGLDKIKRIVTCSYPDIDIRLNDECLGLNKFTLLING